MKTQISPEDQMFPDDHEWLLPFGNGGFAAGTVNGPASRSYHGLLVAGLSQPWDRMLALSHVDVRLILESEDVLEIACHNYGDGVIHPHGRDLLTAFEPHPSPAWCWEGEGWSLSLSLESHQSNAVVISYDLEANFHCTFELRPFVAWRSFHGGESTPFLCSSTDKETFIDFKKTDFRLRFSHDLQFVEDPITHTNFRYEGEIERGLNGHEDLQSPFVLSGKVEPGRFQSRMTAALIDVGETSKTSERLQHPELGFSTVDRLRRAALEFLIVNPATGNPGIIAGYPWFNEWGRDTMIALPGMVMAAKDATLAQRILEGWTKEIKDGLLPNRLAEGEGPCSYNSADAPLWYLSCVERYWDDTQPNDILRAGVQTILHAYLDGTKYDIQVDQTDGLLRAGNANTQLTWMDACHEGECFTPRMGKCVELNALLFKGLRFGAHISSDSEAHIFDQAATRLCQSFRVKFIDEVVGLKDCLSDPHPTLRPNQLFAIGMNCGLLEDSVAQHAFEMIENELLTPFGIRTLDRANPAYEGQYRGGPKERDAAYHQGTVWMWLTGAFVDSLMRVRGNTPDSRSYAESIIASCLENLDQVCLGQLNEIFEGDSPHRPCGAPAQAWSACELLRVIEDYGLNEGRIHDLCLRSS